MRNPIRLKNLNARFLPFYLIGLGVLVFVPVKPSGFMMASPLIALGLFIRSWGAGHLVKNDLLTLTGPYAYLRHPLYAGTILIATGFAILFGGMMAVLMIAAIWPWFGFRYFPRKERVESARLASLYGDAYAIYRDAVPALWPRWTRWTPPDRQGGDSRGMPGLNPIPGEWALERYSDNNELGTVIAVLGGLALIGMRTFLGRG